MAHSMRQARILKIAQSDGQVLVEDLASRFDVTQQTIRRDLSELAAEGKLNRVHGGAMLPQGVINIAYDERRTSQAKAKDAIGRACAAEIPDNSSVFITIGTSTEAVARALVNHRNLTVVTNNLNVANILRTNDSIEIIVAGGLLRRSDGGLVGDVTASAIEQFKVDLAVIGVSAIDDVGDLMDYDLREVRVAKSIIRQARRTLLVADASKLSRSAHVRIGTLAEIDTLYIDALPEDLRERCAHWGTRVVLTEA